MKKYLDNFNRLFSDDDKIVYQALIEKRNWILSSFYIMCSLEHNQDLEDIIDGKLRFRKLYLNDYFFKDKMNQYDAVTEKFNNNFRVLYLNNNMDIVDDDYHFFIKVDFNYLNQTEYKILFANFFPCLNKEDILIENFDDNKELLKLAMDKMVGDNVLILDVNNLIDNAFPCKVITEIIAPNTLNEGYKTFLKQASESVNCKFVEL